MLKANIKKEIIITNKEIAQYLWKDGSFLENIDETLEDMLYNEYQMDANARCGAVDELTEIDYAQILESLANILRVKAMKE